MRKHKIEGKRLFVLDTNVLIHDPTAIFRFKEHDIFIPMVVLEELDNGKKGLSEAARAIRQTNRFLEAILQDIEPENIFNGIDLTPPGDSFPELKSGENRFGRLYLQTDNLSHHLPDSLPGNKSDNSILSTVLALKQKQKQVTITLVTKDINLRIKAAALGIHSEDYFNDQVLDDVSLMYSGMVKLEPAFWDAHGNNMKSWQEDGRTFYAIKGPEVEKWQPNYALFNEKEEEGAFEAVVRQVEGGEASIEYAKDFRRPKNNVCGIVARNREQNFALNLLMDPSIDFLTLVGPAGTGKTLLTLAAAIDQTVKKGLYREILVTRITIPLGEDIGFLPGSEEEKMTPWMGAFVDNLEVLTPEQPIITTEQSNDALVKNRIRIRSLNFMRGRTFLNKFIIIDEAQNLTPKQMRTLITRAGPGTKVICLGNTAQIDTPYLTETTSGLTYAVQQFKGWRHSGHILLSRTERSRLADHANQVL
jgi:PhoH-like ATPase